MASIMLNNSTVQDIQYMSKSVDRIYKNNQIVYERPTEAIEQTIQLKHNGVGGRPYVTMCDGELYLNDGTYVDAIKTITNIMSNPASCKFTYLQNGVELGTVEMSANCAVLSNESMTSPFLLDGTRPYSNIRWMEFAANATDVTINIKITPNAGVDKSKYVKAFVLGYMDRYDISVNSTATSFRYMASYIRDVTRDRVLLDSKNYASTLDAASIRNESNQMAYFGAMVITAKDVKLAYYNPTYDSGLNLDHKLYLKNELTSAAKEATVDEIMANERYDGVYAANVTKHIERTISIDSPWAGSYRSISDGEIILADGTYVDAITTFATTGADGGYGAKFEFKQNGVALGVCVITSSHSTYSNPSHTAWTTPYRSDGVHSYGRWGHTVNLGTNVPITIKFEVLSYSETPAEKVPVAITLSPQDRYSGSYGGSTYVVGKMRDEDADVTLYNTTDSTTYNNTCIISNTFGMTCVITSTCAKMAYYKLAYTVTGTDPQLEQKLYLRSKADPSQVVEKSVAEIVTDGTNDGFINDLDNYPLQSALLLKRAFSTTNNYATLSNAFIIGNDGVVANKFEVVSDSSNTLVPGTIGYTETFKASYYDAGSDTTTEIGTIMLRCSAQSAYTTYTSLGALFGDTKKYLPVNTYEISATQDNEYTMEFYATSGIKAIVVGLYAVSETQTSTSDQCWSYVKDNKNNRVVYEVSSVNEYKELTTKALDDTAHYRLGLVITKDNVYDTWVKVALANYGTSTTNGNAEKYHQLYLKGDVIDDIKEFSLDNLIANGEVNGTYHNDISLLPQVDVVFKSPDKASLNLGTVYDNAGSQLTGIALKSQGTDNSNHTYSVIKSGANNVYVSSDYTPTNTDINSLFMDDFVTIGNSNNTDLSVKVASTTAKYLAVSPLNFDFKYDGGLSAEITEGNDYYKFIMSGASVNMIERFKFHLKDGSVLKYLGYIEQTYNGTFGGETFYSNHLLLFTKDQTVTGIKTTPPKVTYDATNENLVQIRVLVKTAYYTGDSYSMKYAFHEINDNAGAYPTMQAYSVVADNTPWYIIFPKDNHLTLDDIDHFTFGNFFSGSTGYAYNQYGFTSITYCRVDANKGTEIHPETQTFTKQTYPITVKRADELPATEITDSTYLKVDTNEILNVDTRDKLTTEIKTVNDVEYISRYVIDIETKEYAKSWIKRKLYPNEAGKLLIHNTAVDKMIAMKATDIVTNKYPNGESSDAIALPNKFKLTLNTDRGYNSYPAFYLGLPVINGVLYECVETSRYESITSSNGTSNPTYHKLRGIADVSTAEKRLAYINGTNKGVTYATSSGKIFTVNSSLNGNSTCAANEIIIRTTFNMRWNSSSEYQTGYLYKGISNTYAWYVLMNYSSTGDAWCEYEILTGQTIEGMIIIPYSTNTHGGRLCYHNIIEFKTDDEVVFKVEDEISGTSTSDFVNNRAFYADLVAETVTQIN